MGGALQRMAAQAERRRGGGGGGGVKEVVDGEEGEAGEVAGTESEAPVDAGKAKAKGRKRKLPAAEVEEDADEAGEKDGSDFEAPKRKTRKGRGGAKSARGRGK
jgi:hypothetical protein